MTTDYRRTAAQLDQADKQTDTSLRGKSLARALGDKVPTTLTPHEWEQWYAEHGVPASHRVTSRPGGKAWWQFWKRTS